MIICKTYKYQRTAGRTYLVCLIGFRRRHTRRRRCRRYIHSWTRSRRKDHRLRSYPEQQWYSGQRPVPRPLFKHKSIHYKPIEYHVAKCRNNFASNLSVLHVTQVTVIRLFFFNDMEDLKFAHANYAWYRESWHYIYITKIIWNKTQYLAIRIA